MAVGPSQRFATGAAGVAIVAGYVAVAALSHVSGWHLRPLYDTIAPPAPYRWVRPPPMFAPGNAAPQPAQGRVEFVSGKSSAVTVATPDGQCVVSFAAGALVAGSAAGPAVTGGVAVSPVDPLTLGPLPEGLHPVGNAYEIRISINGEPVRAVGAAGDVVLALPEPAQTVLFSSDGRSWTRVQTQPVSGASTLGTPTLQTSGYVVAATAARPVVRHPSGTIVVAVAVGLIALVLGGAPALRSVLRRRA